MKVLIRKTWVSLFIILVFYPLSVIAQGLDLPTAEEMRSLRPRPRFRLLIFDKLFPVTAQGAYISHLRYSNPEVLSEIEERLWRVTESSNPHDFLNPEEWQQFEKNRRQLRVLEERFFNQWRLRLPMDAAVHLQRWMSTRNSPQPIHEKREALLVQLEESVARNPLYAFWDKSLPKSLREHHAIQTWGDLFLQFNSNPDFRDAWVERHPETLPRLKKFAEILSWEDPSVRSVTIFHQNSPREYWVVMRRDRPSIPNRFQITLSGDLNRLLDLEYKPTLFFNRVTKITQDGAATTFYFEAIEKGRTMELASALGWLDNSKKSFRGAKFLRKSKSDEFPQRRQVKDGSLSLFLGMRTLQFNQLQQLVSRNPTLVFSLGQFGFSVTGGTAQTVSNRTDSVDDQLRKATATLIDIVEFAQLDSIQEWFNQNTKLVIRTMVTGVGAGGVQSLPATNLNPVAGGDRSSTKPLLCKEVLN